MEGNQSRLSELAISDCKDSSYQINIVKLQPDGFAETQPRYGEKTKETIVRPGPVMSPAPRHAQKPLDFLVTVDVWTRTRIPITQQAQLRNFCPSIKDHRIFCQSAHHGKSPL